MYLLPWHSLSKTGSHLSTSIRWYSMGQPLSLAMIISDVTSCPETIPYAVFDVHRSRYLLLSRKRSCKRRDRFYSKDLLFLRSLPCHYWSPIKNKKKRKNRHGWNPEDWPSFYFPPLSRIGRAFPCRVSPCLFIPL